MHKRNMLMVTASIALIAVGAAAIANDARGPGSDRGKFRGERGDFGGAEQMLRMMNRHLELDETQSQRLESIVAAAKPEFDVLREKRRTNREALRTLDVDDPDYGAKLDNLSAENGELAQESTRLVGRMRAEIHAVLTPEQQQELEERTNRMHERGMRGGKRSGARHEPAE